MGYNQYLTWCDSVDKYQFTDLITGVASNILPGVIRQMQDGSATTYLRVWQVW